jgi:two-component system sensor histidine kinase GlrK
MRLYRPHSFFALLLTGFFFVSLPLLTALYSSVQILDGLMLQSITAVYRSVDMVTSSREITELLQDEERKARVYNVLSEPAQLQEVNKAHEDIEKALEYLIPFNSDEELVQLIEELQFKENYIVAVLNNITGDPEQIKKEQEQVLTLYQDLTTVANSIVRSSNNLMINEVETLKLKVKQDKEKLMWQTSGLISSTIILIIVFMALISKPIRQINKGIERLGDGNFTTPVNVLWPKDLHDLGQKLDWLRKRLAKLDKEKIKLIAHISHDLKTPLASIKEGASLLRDELLGPINNEQKEIVAILDKNCSKLQALIENILSFNMAQARDTPDEKKSIKLDELIETVVADHRNSILARKIKLDVQLDDMEVNGNRKQLKTVFDNIVSNAVKFTPENGIIRISLKKDGKLAACLVEDSGPGIDEEDRARIFSPFFQGKGSQKAVVKGSGLGLAITKEYVQNHEGTIRLLTGKKGARFLVTLPLSG